MRFISRFKLLCAIVVSILLTSCATDGNYSSSGQTYATTSSAPTEPILRIDPAMHTAPIRRIATDAHGRWLATASSDKTVRLWSLADGKLMSTLRPPVGLAHEGGLNSVAMSPDGSTIAVSGWTRFANDSSLPSSEGSEGFAIYLFDRASGRMLRSITGLTNVVYHLNFSHDGRWLVAALASGGVRIFDSASGQLLAEDRDYGGGRSYSAHFSNDGRLVTTSTDGFLRLYRFDGQSLSQLAKRASPEGIYPNAARFSPDGKLIAVSFGGDVGNVTPSVNILDARSLSLEYAPDTNEIGGALSAIQSVEWSKDGRTLFASGIMSHDDYQNIFVRQWSNSGKGYPVDNNVARRGINDLLTLSDGSLIFCGIAEWGVINQSGQRSIFQSSVLPDYRLLNQGFRLSADGGKVGFAYEYRGKSPAVFDANERSLLVVNPSGLNPPQTQAYGWNLHNMDTNGPEINGARLKLQVPQFEYSRSYAFLPGGDGLALGTDYNLYNFDRNGNQLWKQTAPGTVWAVNVSQDGRWVVAAYLDGTIRWHRASDGVEQLAFFPHADKKRWVMWSPSGYYDASPGAEDLIGWHVNRGKDHEADFYPASRFRDHFYRPDILAQVLSTQDEDKAVRLANQESGRRTQPLVIAQVLPPVVEIVSPASDSRVDSGTIKVRYTVRTAADAPVTGMRVRVNGLLQSDTRALKLVKSDGDTQEIDVNMPEQDAEIQLFAENKNSASTPAILRLKWAAKAVAVAKPSKPNLYVLAVGVSKYANPDYNLGLAAKDAQDFVNSLKAQKGKLYDNVDVKLLTDENAMRDDVLEGLDWLKEKVTAKDVGIMFVAGHGINDKLGGYYFLPHNADPEKLSRTAVSQDDIKRTFTNLPGKTVFFIDTCYSGGALGTVRTAGFVNDMASAENGSVVFTASSSGQLSQENSSWGNGAFTKSVVEGLNGSADFRKSGFITAKGLDYYVDDRVKTLTHGQQTPVSISPGGVSDFPITEVRR